MFVWICFGMWVAGFPAMVLAAAVALRRYDRWTARRRRDAVEARRAEYAARRSAAPLTSAVLDVAPIAPPCFHPIVEHRHVRRCGGCAGCRAAACEAGVT